MKYPSVFTTEPASWRSLHRGPPATEQWPQNPSIIPWNTGWNRDSPWIIVLPQCFVFQFFIPQLIINIHQPTGRPVKHTILNWAMGWSITSNELSRTRRSAIRWNEPAKDVGPLIQPRCEPWCWNIYIHLRYIHIYLQNWAVCLGFKCRSTIPAPWFASGQWMDVPSWTKLNPWITRKSLGIFGYPVETPHGLCTKLLDGPKLVGKSCSST